MPTLYTMPGTCALAPNIAAAWLDAPVDIALLQRGQHREPAYLAINPQGKVPALRFEDGRVLTEAAAILAWLGATHGSARYARDQWLGAEEAEALSYMTSEVHAAYGPHFSAQRFATSEAGQAEVKAATYQTLADHYRFMDGKLAAKGDWYLGERSFADAYLYVLSRWIDQTPLVMTDYPAVKAHRARMEADGGVRLALHRQQMEPLG